jgi:ABC-2 type transport system ATP-binding protein
VISELVADGTTLLLTTQYLEEADRLADRIVLIDQGRIIAEGTSSELKATLGATTIEVTLGNARAAKRAAKVLGADGSGRVLADGRTVAVGVADSGRALVEAVRALDEAGLGPERLAVREPTLDDVFLRLTGHAARQEEAESTNVQGGR